MKEVTEFISRFKRIAALVRPEPTLRVIEEDPADNRVLECAADAGASYVVSGDDHLPSIKEYRGIVILKPADFLVLVKSNRDL